MEQLMIYTLLAWIHLFPEFLHLNPSHYFVESRDFCLHESFNATCRPGSVVLQMTGTYGRMKLGRCINGNYNIGCSKDVIKYLDSRCSGRETCDVNIRNLVDVHPCQRDFMSYLEASYKCIEVAGYGLSVCPREAHLTLTDPKGYMSNMQSPAIGSETCPWRIIARPGQSIELKIIVINSESTLPTTSDDMVVCSAVIVVNDEFVGVKEFNICAAGKNRERQLFTSSGRELTVHWTSGSQQETSPRFIMSYDATGCPDLEVPQNAWMKRTGDNVIIKCNNSMETWYFTCQRSQWIGELGNCSDRISRLKKESSAKEHLTLPAHGIALAVTIGVLLGVFVGVILLLVANCARRRTKRNLRKRQKFSSSNQKDGSLVDDQGSFYRSSKTRHQGDSYPTLLTGKDKVYNVEKVYDFSGSNLGGLQDNDSKCSFYPLSVTPEMSMRNESIDIYNTGSDVDAHKVRTPSQHRCYAHRMQPISGSRPGNEFAGNDVVGRGSSLDQFGSPAGVAYRKTIWPTEAGRSVSEEISLHPAGLYCSRKEAPLLSLRSETRQTIQLKSSNDPLVAS